MALQLRAPVSTRVCFVFSLSGAAKNTTPSLKIGSYGPSGYGMNRIRLRRWRHRLERKLLIRLGVSEETLDFSLDLARKVNRARARRRKPPLGIRRWGEALNGLSAGLRKALRKAVAEDLRKEQRQAERERRKAPLH